MLSVDSSCNRNGCFYNFGFNQLNHNDTHLISTILSITSSAVRENTDIHVTNTALKETSNTCMYMYVHVYTCTCTCIYLYMYMYVHTCVYSTCTCTMYNYMKGWGLQSCNPQIINPLSWNIYIFKDVLQNKGKFSVNHKKISLGYICIFVIFGQFATVTLVVDSCCQPPFMYIWPAVRVICCICAGDLRG